MNNDTPVLMRYLCVYSLTLDEQWHACTDEVFMCLLTDQVMNNDTPVLMRYLCVYSLARWWTMTRLYWWGIYVFTHWPSMNNDTPVLMRYLCVYSLTRWWTMTRLYRWGIYVFTHWPGDKQWHACTDEVFMCLLTDQVINNDTPVLMRYLCVYSLARWWTMTRLYWWGIYVFTHWPSMNNDTPVLMRYLCVYSLTRWWTMTRLYWWGIYVFTHWPSMNNDTPVLMRYLCVYSLTRWWTMTRLYWWGIYVFTHWPDDKQLSMDSNCKVMESMFESVFYMKSVFFFLHCIYHMRISA